MKRRERNQLMRCVALRVSRRDDRDIPVCSPAAHAAGYEDGCSCGTDCSCGAFGSQRSSYACGALRAEILGEYPKRKWGVTPSRNVCPRGLHTQVPPIFPGFWVEIGSGRKILIASKSRVARV